jgi:hypothetical protein
MQCAEYLVPKLQGRLEIPRRAATLAFSVVASIGIACRALKAQQGGLDSILDEITSGHNVSLRASLPSSS